MSDSTKRSLIGARDGAKHDLTMILPAAQKLFADAGDEAIYRLLDFLCATIRNRNTREAYGRAIDRFCRWCDAHDLTLLTISSLAIARYIEDGCPEVCPKHGHAASLSDPSVKQHLSAIKMLFDHLVTGHIVPVNPAASVRGPKHVVGKGKTPVLDGPDAQRLLSTIPTHTLAGLRDRALIGAMIYSFARVSALLGMNVEDYHCEPAGRTMSLRLQEKNGKHHDVPAHHRAARYLDAYIVGANLGTTKGTPLFRSIGRHGEVTGHRLDRRDAWAMIKRRALQAGLSPEICCHTFRATGITCYLNSGGSLENAQLIAAHSSPRTTKLYDRTVDLVTLDEINRIRLDPSPAHDAPSGV
jgi:integrase/recombinase XerD